MEPPQLDAIAARQPAWGVGFLVRKGTEMTSRVGLVWWIVLIAVIGLLISGAGDALVPDRCRDECKERADRRFGPSWSPWKHIYESGCQFGCWVGGGPTQPPQ